ncbi:MAG: ABC transporter substrate-binding protein [Clostridia bacterium]
MKKGFIIVVALLLIATSVLFVSCKQVEEATLNVFLPDGAPALSMAKTMSNTGKYGKLTLKHNIVTGDAIVAKVANGEADMAIIPTNAMAILYNKGAKYKIVSSNVFGVLYLVSKQTTLNIADLTGQIVYIIGEGNTPDLVFKYILQQNNLEFVKSATAVEGKVALNYVNDGSELIPLLKQGKAKFGVLGEPAVSNAIAKAGVNVVLDLQAEWKKHNASSYPQASLVVKNEVLEKYGKDIDKIVEDLKGNKQFILDNISVIGKLMADNGSLLAVNYTKEIVERCNLDCVSATDAKMSIEEYFNILLTFNAKYIGGKIPDKNLYYIK